METNNEVKRTQGEWNVYITERGKDNCRRYYINSALPKDMYETICVMSGLNGTEPGEIAQANAEFICEAANNYGKLKKDNAALQKALSTLTGMHSNLKEDNALLLEALRWITQIDRTPDNYLKLVQIAKDAIQKVKK